MAKIYFLDNRSSSTINLTITVYKYNKPHVVHKFIPQNIISLVWFEYKVDLTIHRNLREGLRYENVIVNEEDEKSYNSIHIVYWIEYFYEELIYFPNSYSCLETFITDEEYLFDETIVKNSLTIRYIPHFINTELFVSQE